MAKRKQVSHLLKLMKSKEDNVYETTIEDCEKWFNILNKEVFDNKLIPLDEIDIRWRHGAYAYYKHVFDDDDSNYGYSKLCMNKRYSSKKFFVEVLAHELIHHYQIIHDEPIGHGPSFLCWRDKLNRKGLALAKAYII